MSVDIACKLLRRKRREVKWKKLFRKKGEKLPTPLLYSSIPVRVSRKEDAVILTDKHLLLQEKLVQGSVIFIDEIGSFCSQFDYKAKNTDVFDEFVRFYRHYTKGGFFVCNDQCSENIVLQVSRRINTVYNLYCYNWLKKRKYKRTTHVCHAQLYKIFILYSWGCNKRTRVDTSTSYPYNTTLLPICQEIFQNFLTDFFGIVVLGLIFLFLSRFDLVIECLDFFFG